MTQSPLLQFESTAFAVTPGEDAETNPGIFGKALAEWLAVELRSSGVETEDVIAEDFGWCVRIRSQPHSLYVVCSNADDRTDLWRAFVFAEGGVVARLLGRDTRAKSVAEIFKATRACLEASPSIRAVKEEL